MKTEGQLIDNSFVRLGYSVRPAENNGFIVVIESNRNNPDRHFYGMDKFFAFSNSTDLMNFLQSAHSEPPIDEVGEQGNE